ncbi:thiolase [Holophaga foetida]|uniref:thiolase family protein n=1 Tax=Holophaga foetida TaxID=35839 RepID=UPI00024753BE|nr:thiolase [Holophaga foetida]
MAVFLRSAARTPYGAFGGAFRRVAPEQLAAWAIREALGCADMPPGQVDALILGQALRYGRGANPARRAAQAAGLGTTCAAWGVDQGRASGLRALVAGLHAIEAGAHTRLVVAAADSASTVPYLIPAGRWGHRLGQSTAMDPLLLDAPERDAIRQQAMTQRQAELGICYDSLINWATHSREKALSCPALCFPVTIAARKGPTHLESDEILGMAPPSPEPGWPLPPLADAAAALVMSAEGPGIRIAGFREAWADRPTEALLGAVGPLLESAALTPEDLDQVEVDESLLLSPLGLLQALPGLDPRRVNPGGGAFATGQAHSTEGLRLLISLFHGLERTGGRFGLAAMETADGLGLAILLERTPA